MPSTRSILKFIKEFGWLATVVGALVAAILAYVQYLHTSKLEYVKAFNAKQLDITFQTAETVASLVSADDPILWKNYTSQFWKLYWGPLVLFETHETEKAMVAFGRALTAASFENRALLGRCAYDVSKSLRKFIEEKNAKDWRVSLDTLVDIKRDGPDQRSSGGAGGSTGGNCVQPSAK